MTVPEKLSFSGYTLGLDLGPNSIGWALIETKFEEGWKPDINGDVRLYVQATDYAGFLDTSKAKHPPMGVRIFEAGLDNFNSAKEKPLNQKRRDARSARRVHARRNARRKALRNILVKANFLPATEDQREALYNETDVNGNLVNNPYRLRAKGLDGALTSYELGRVIYHFAQRRGFKSNRKSDKEQDEKGMLLEMKDLAVDIESSGSRTLGEYLWKHGWNEDGSSKGLARSKDGIRGRHTRREMYEKELKLLLDSQERFHPGLSALRGGAELPGTIEHAVFFQHSFELTDDRRAKAPSRANLHRAPQVKACPLEPGQSCCTKSAWIAQRFRILKEVNNLKIIENFNWKAARFLNQDERQFLVDLLSEQQKVSFDKMRKDLANRFGTDPKAYFNLERGGRDDLQGNAIDAKIAGLIGKPIWRHLEHDAKETLRNAIVHEEDPEHLLRAYQPFELDEKKTRTLLAFNPESDSGYIGFSETALHKLVPLLEDGKNEHEALTESYPNRPEANAFTRKYKNGKTIGALPYLQHPDLPHELRDITNPIVRRGLSEVRKVVNAIIREHGLPNQIVVELARDMKMGKKERKEVSMRNNYLAKVRETAASEVFGLGGNPHSSSDILRYMLWVEQNKLCIYSGKPIPQSALFSAALDVDHILPHWQSLDDSQLNKVLCYRELNAEKGQRLPMQWLGESSKRYEILLLQTMEFVEKNDRERQQKRFEGIKKLGLSTKEQAVMYSRLRGAWPQRLRRMMQDEIDASGFTNRQLNDTRYLSRSVVRFLELLYPPERRIGEKAVRSTRGGLTAEIRRHWGLNSVLSEDPIRDSNGIPLNNEDPSGRKQRIDHRHHAVDALVVALSSRSTLQKYQTHFREKEEFHAANQERREMEKGSFPFPWEGFRPEVVKNLKQVIVSHRVQRKIRGAFHEETFFGVARHLRGVEKPGRYVTRKPLESLTKSKHLAEIRDPLVKVAIINRLIDLGWDSESSNLPKDWWREGVHHPNGLPIRRVRIEVGKDTNKMLALGDKGHRHAAKGNNHHAVLVECNSIEGRKILVSIVPRADCATRVHNEKKPAVDRNLPNEKKFLMSLSRKEAVEIKHLETGITTLCHLQKISGTPQLSTGGFDIYFRDLRDSRPASEGNKRPFSRICSSKGFSNLKVQKIQVDPIGRLSYPND